MLNVTITKNTKALDNLRKCFSDFTPFLEILGLQSAELIRKEINHGVDASGNRLMPNAPLTVELKAGLATPLIASGFMRDSITSMVDGHSVLIGSGLQTQKGGYNILSIMQSGATIRAKNYPFLRLPGNAFTARRMQGAGGLGKTSKVKITRSVSGKRFTSTETQSIKYIFTKQVTLPPRKVLPEGAIENYPEWLRMLKRVIEKFLKLENK